MGANPTSSAVPEPSTGRPALLLVDDDSIIGESLAFVLEEGFEVRWVEHRAAAKAALQSMARLPDLALVDLGLPPSPHMPDEGFALIAELLTLNPLMKVLVLSGQSDRHNVQHALTLGAVDFIPKPCDPQLLRARLEHQLMLIAAERDQESTAEPGTGLLGRSRAMEELRTQVANFADTPFPVLVEGESGTGKELVAELLHQQSDKRNEPFVTVNCAAITPDLLEAQLFGHAKGAFTGAASAREGFFETAGAGTLFLDEIGEFPVGLQPKLLRVLENGEFYRLGETRPRTAKARVVAATNRDLLEEIRAGRFRHDLYHRLSVLSIRVPPLRQRGDDPLMLLSHFQALYATQVRPFELDAEASERLLRYVFPGNVRELRNIVIRLGAKYPGRSIGLTELEPELDSQSEIDESTIGALSDGNFKLDVVLDGWEQRYINAALRLANGNLSEAARLLGVNRTTLYSKIQRLSQD